MSLGVRLAYVWILGAPILGIVVFEMIFAFFNLLEHSDIVLPQKLERRLARLLYLITHSMHRRHHSISEEYTPNFGTILSIWDILLGTLNVRRSQDIIDVGTPEVGNHDLTLGSLVLHPFYKWRVIGLRPFPQNRQEKRGRDVRLSC